MDAGQQQHPFTATGEPIITPSRTWCWVSYYLTAVDRKESKPDFGDRSRPSSALPTWAPCLSMNATSGFTNGGVGALSFGGLTTTTNAKPDQEETSATHSHRAVEVPP